MFIISEDLWTRLQGKDITVRLHSCFHSALNLSGEHGLVTMLSGERCLQPSSILFDVPLDFTSLCIPDGGLCLRVEGLFQEDRTFFRFPTLHVRELTLQNTEAIAESNASAIRGFLLGQEEKGIHGLIELRCDNVFASFLAPRIEAFRTAVRSGELTDISEAVTRLAGCGPGLTPSSDDFLCGYISVFPQTAQNRLMCSAIVDAAVKKTNDISAALLLYAKAGLFSADILDLFSAFRTGTPDLIQEAMRRVARFGSSSGCDFLTGMYYGILDSNKKEG